MENFIKTTLSVGMVLAAIYLINFFQSLGLPYYLSILIGVLLSVISLKTLDFFIFEKLISLFLFRKIIDPRSSVEGIWFEQIDALEDRPYAILNIFFNAHSKKYFLSGKVFTPKGMVRARLKSEELIINPNNDKVLYIYNTYRKYDNLSDTFGFTKIDFQRNGKHQYQTGNGQYNDSDREDGSYTFSLNRITEKDILEFIDKKFFSSEEDEALFIQAYHNRNKAR